MARAQHDERDSLPREVARIWTTAPMKEIGGSGRWVRFDRPGGGVVYVQRYAWDEPCVSHFLVVTCDSRGRTSQHRYDSLPPALDAVRRMLLG